MGTALTGEQVGELARMAQTVLLALDADSAGQEAMLKAFRLANKRKLELRVVMLPAGTDPAELIQRDGAEAMQAAVEGSISFVRFRAERVLASGDPSNSEDQDRMIDELRPVFAELPPSALRMELTRTVDSRMALPEGVAEKLLAAAPSAARRGADGGQGRTPRGDGDGGGDPVRARQPRVSEMTRREETERAFLALCIASPRGRGAGARGPGHRRALLQRPAAPRGQAPARGRPACADERRRRTRASAWTTTRS